MKMLYKEYINERENYIMKKRRLTLIFCGILIALSACAKEPQEETLTTVDQAETETRQALTEEDQIYQVLPTGDFGGYECHFAQYIFDHLGNMSKYQITVDDIIGEVVNDALYNIARTVENRLNVHLKTDVYTNRQNMATTLTSSIMAGDDLCDAFFCLDANQFFAQGSIINMSEISTMNFDNVWWNRNAIDSVRLTDDVYLGYGTLSTMQYANQVVTLFNKKIAADIDMEDPYTMVREGRWTLETMKTYISQAVKDVNGDGIMNAKNDIYGYSACEPGMFKMLYGCNVSLFDRTADGTISYGGVNEEFYTVFSKLSEVFSDKQSFYLGWGTTGISQYHMMKTDQTLFADQLVLELEELRDMESDYGVLPSPKYDESQQEYYSYIYYDCAPLAIPITVDDPERTGTILENLCAETYRSVKDVYLDDLLNQKLLRDDESIEMMNMILTSKAVVDPCYIYNWGSVKEVIISAMKRNSTDIVSKIEKIETKITQGITDMVELT